VFAPRSRPNLSGRRKCTNLRSQTVPIVTLPPLDLFVSDLNLLTLTSRVLLIGTVLAFVEFRGAGDQGGGGERPIGL
jgi:hypothetical protein